MPHSSAHTIPRRIGIRADRSGWSDIGKYRLEKLKYLDLEISNKSRIIITLEKHKHNCYFSSIYKYNLHSKEDKNYNSLIDLVISLGESLEN